MCECISQFGVKAHSKDCKVGFPNKPHVHAELIKAWADGAEIEYLHDGISWRTILNNPSWASGVKYRIKPQPPKEPDYAFIAHKSWYETAPTNDAWKRAATAVIKAYQDFHTENSKFYLDK